MTVVMLLSMQAPIDPNVKGVRGLGQQSCLNISHDG